MWHVIYIALIFAAGEKTGAPLFQLYCSHAATNIILLQERALNVLFLFSSEITTSLLFSGSPWHPDPRRRHRRRQR
jgi:hypothetical protein